MDASTGIIGETELDLIEKMDEVLNGSNSMNTALQMALDLICIGLNCPNGGLVVPPHLRQENTLILWHNPHPAWLREERTLSEPVLGLVGTVLKAGHPQVLAETLAIPVIYQKNSAAILLLKRSDISAAEQETLSVLTRFLGKKIRHFQATKATVERDQLLSALGLISLAQSTQLNIEDVKSRIIASILNTYKAQGIILVLLSEEVHSAATRQVFLKKKGWFEPQSIEFSRGLLADCIQQGRLLQWRDASEQPGANPEVDRIKEFDNTSLVGVPLLAAGRKTGVLGIVNSALFPLEEADQSILIAIIGLLAQTFSNVNLAAQLKNTADELMLRQSEAATSRNALKVLFESIPFSFYIINQEYQIVAINSVRAKLAEATTSQLLGKVCYQGLYQEQKICPGCLVNATLQTGKVSTRSKRTWQKDDTASDWEVNCYAINNSQGRAVQAILVEQEVTEKRRLEAELIQNEKLVATGQLAASVAHEINNPLAAVIANAQILLQDIPPENQELIESVKLIELAGLRASHVVKNLLGLARKEEYDFTPVDLNESIQDALSLLSHEFVARPITIRFERGQNLPPILASREHLESIWINLLMNSIESINSEAGSIEINTFYDEGNFYVLIKDSGEGIPEEQLGRIFEPFYTTKSHSRGTGLGLSVVKRSVKAHSGSIQVDSELGKGTTFTIILPENPLGNASSEPAEE